MFSMFSNVLIMLLAKSNSRKVLDTCLMLFGTSFRFEFQTVNISNFINDFKLMDWFTPPKLDINRLLKEWPILLRSGAWIRERSKCRDFNSIVPSNASGSIFWIGLSIIPMSYMKWNKKKKQRPYWHHLKNALSRLDMSLTREIFVKLSSDS